MKPSSSPDARLGVMLFLHFAMLGVWFPILPSYLKADPSAGGLGFDGYQVGWIVGVAPALAAMVSPFLVGQVTDRLVAGERYLAGALVAAGAIHWVLSYQTSFVAWAVLSLLYAVCYFPTMGLVNSLAMAHLTDAGRQFGKVRLWGTLGWIAVAWMFPLFENRPHFRLGTALLRPATSSISAAPQVFLVSSSEDLQSTLCILLMLVKLTIVDGEVAWSLTSSGPRSAVAPTGAAALISEPGFRSLCVSHSLSIRSTRTWPRCWNLMPVRPFASAGEPIRWGSVRLCMR